MIINMLLMGWALLLAGLLLHLVAALSGLLHHLKLAEAHVVFAAAAIRFRTFGHRGIRSLGSRRLLSVSREPGTGAWRIDGTRKQHTNAYHLQHNPAKRHRRPL